MPAAIEAHCARGGAEDMRDALIRIALGFDLHESANSAGTVSRSSFAWRSSFACMSRDLPALASVSMRARDRTASRGRVLFTNRESAADLRYCTLQSGAP
jgi:hypothetical protein